MKMAPCAAPLTGLPSCRPCAVLLALLALVWWQSQPSETVICDCPSARLTDTHLLLVKLTVKYLLTTC